MSGGIEFIKVEGQPDDPRFEKTCIPEVADIAQRGCALVALRKVAWDRRDAVAVAKFSRLIAQAEIDFANAIDGALARATQ